MPLYTKTEFSKLSYALSYRKRFNRFIKANKTRSKQKLALVALFSIRVDNYAPQVPEQ